jgi:PIN domain nuclease of toxin-antitoxin system
VIVLDTHIWVWWVQGNPKLPPAILDAVKQNEPSGLGVSAISCWEIAKSVSRGRLDLGRPLAEWFATALGYPGILLIDLTPQIAIEATSLPQPFHRDPADEIIVATARVNGCPLATCDSRILKYAHVQLV